MPVTCTVVYVRDVLLLNAWLWGFSGLLFISCLSWCLLLAHVVNNGSVWVLSSGIITVDNNNWVFGYVGSEAERGIKPSSSAVDMTDENTSAADDGIPRGSSLSVSNGKFSTYDLPLCMSLIRRHTCHQFLPFCPTFAGFTWVQQRLCGSPDEPPPTSAAVIDNDNDVEEPIELQ